MGARSRLRRLVVSDRWFFVACRVLPRRGILFESDFAFLARAADWRIRARPALRFTSPTVPIAILEMTIYGRHYEPGKLHITTTTPGAAVRFPWTWKSRRPREQIRGTAFSLPAGGCVTIVSWPSCPCPSTGRMPGIRRQRTSPSLPSPVASFLLDKA